MLQVSYPPEGVRPNFRPRHPAQKFKAIEAYRTEAFVAGRAARMNIGHATLRAPVVAHVLFITPDNRDRDQDNFTASLKAVWDGLVLSKLLEGDAARQLRIMPVDFQKGIGGRKGVLIRLIESPPPIVRGGRD